MKDRNVKGIIQSIIEKETDKLMGISFSCVCGRTHAIPIEYLSVKKGAILEVKHQMDKLGVSGNGGLIYDKRIEGNIGKKVLQTLKDQGVFIKPYPVGDGNEILKPEIEVSKRIADRIDTGTDYLISAGSGVVSDLTKNAAALVELPFMLIATAPSMNGYTSSMAALTDKGIKKTLYIPSAKAVFADINILKDSPIEMIRSGLGDIVSKSVCNADWKISQLIKNTYFCPFPYRLTAKTEPLYLEAAEQIGQGTDYGIKILTDGIMRSGLSMTVVGTSTPSSGAEHFLSHHWDLMALKEGKESHLHGVQVGVATIIILKLYDYIRNYPVRKRLNLSKLKKNYPSRKSVHTFIEQQYGKYAEEINKEYFQKYMDWKDKEKEIEYIIEKWPDIWNELDPYIHPTKPVEEALKKSGAAVYYSHLGKTTHEVACDLRNAMLIRGRYTALDLAKDLDILDEAAVKIL